MKSNLPQRFKDENYTIYDFQNEIFVVCPRCSKRAVVTKQTPDSNSSERTLNCPHCHYSLKGRKGGFRVELKCHCARCGSAIDVTIPCVNEKKESLAIKCPNCGITASYEPRNIPLVQTFCDEGQQSEPYFGLPLWLSSNFKNAVFWAYNNEHLEYLKKYIGADLRERNQRTHWTLVEKLPAWMKSGKNRTKLLKLIEELEQK